MLIVGKEGEGKTSLLHYLRENKAIEKPTEITDGVEVNTWKVKGKEGKEVRISTWDFAGQKVINNKKTSNIIEKVIVFFLNDF